MTREQITKATEDAASWEHHRSKVCENDGDMAAIKGAIQAHKEWRRIGYVMAEENMETYNPDADPTVQRWRREDAERQAAENAAQHHATENTSEQPAASDPRTQTVRTALARAGLHRLDDDDHQAVEQLAALLDDATLRRVADWLERTREAALQQAAGRPQRPAYRRPRPDSWPQRT
ncbi:hypothetical protein OG689_44640 [Kitasatospora sp. NBC_00240]|uniref:hypothetical protein n=1 Tax=Kitasatospora sp. NBC_00240 TaxID=2903567 RepID=UPI002251CD61|nr:hypothetical protein [Kitasatospora sp. NBC_00240]MCX5216228.1 hypothetical protein [Kitasatospora sp. NBC_00240]